jgi:hypothetical protein
MSDSVAYARSNFFKVKDSRAFEEFCGKWNLEMLRGGEDEGETPLYGFICSECIPHHYYDEKSGECVDGNFMEVLATHLAEGWVAVVREIGYEKMRYLVGYTVAINAAGQSLEVSLDDIYDLAKQLGKHITSCEE